LNHWGKAVDVSQSDDELLDELPYGAQTFGASGRFGDCVGGYSRRDPRHSAPDKRRHLGSLTNRRPGELCWRHQLHGGKCDRDKRCRRGDRYMDSAVPKWLDRAKRGNDKLIK
jgi:hypothetical protein